MPDASSRTRVIAGDCTTTFEPDGTTRRGHVVCLVKPDNTVLVHDADGYQPVAWLTRPDSVSVARDYALVVEARDGDRVLRCVFAAVEEDIAVRAGEAGVPVGQHPGTDAPLVRSRGAVVDTETGERWSLPSGATVLEAPCGACGLPTMAVERGERFEVCLDRTCDPLDERVREAFDRAWTCPACGDDLRILRRGGLIAGCDSYPDCETGFAIPDGVVAGTCDCGLPAFRTGRGVRCLDSGCGLTGDGEV